MIEPKSLPDLVAERIVDADDEPLSFSYFYWARREAIGIADHLAVTRGNALPVVRSHDDLMPPDVSPRPIVDDPDSRLPAVIERSLRCIVLTEFLVEHRFKQAIQKVEWRHTRTIHAKWYLRRDLRKLLKNGSGLWSRLERFRRWDSEELCKQPEQWTQVKPGLVKLWNLRCKIAHGNYQWLKAKVINDKLPPKALDLYNNAVKAVGLVNEGVGYGQTVQELEHLLGVGLDSEPA